ncbi:MAG: hypothetical protein ACOZEN_16085 [Thermodesulfobacteriota bacterium]
MSNTLLRRPRRLALVSGAARQARIAAIKERFASGRARKDDLVRNMELVDPR